MRAKATMEIAVGRATKYKKVKLNPRRVVAMYKDGKNVSQIALAVGYPANTGNNRVRRVLMAAGVYKSA